MFCPIIKEECKKKECAWYIDNKKACAIFIIAEELRIGIDVSVI